MNINTKKYYDYESIGGGVPEDRVENARHLLKLRAEEDFMSSGSFSAISIGLAGISYVRYNAIAKLMVEFSDSENSLSTEKLKEQEQEIERLKAENERLRGEGWISVEDRLPNFDEHVLVFGEKRGMNPSMGGAYIFICNRRNLKGTSLEKDPNRYVEENQFIAQYVTHWQPLPPPPKSK